MKREKESMFPYRKGGNKNIRDARDEKTVLDNQKVEKDGVDLERRDFLKKGAVGLGTGLATYFGASRILKYFDEEKDTEKKQREVSDTDQGQIESMDTKYVDTEKNKEYENENDKELEKTRKEIKEEKAEEESGKKSMKKESYAREHMSPEDIAKEILDTFESPDIYRRIPDDIFETDFYIAQQFQESRYNIKAVSSADAKGPYQNLPISTVEVVEFLSHLRKKGLINNYDGPIDINKKTAEAVTDLFTKNGNYGRAVGKLYMLCFYDPDYKYNNKNKSPIDSQRHLLAMYIEGPDALRKSPGSWSKDTKQYIKFVFEHKDKINRIRVFLNSVGKDYNNDQNVVNFLQELDRSEYKKKEVDGMMLAQIAKKKLKIKKLV